MGWNGVGLSAIWPNLVGVNTQSSDSDCLSPEEVGLLVVVVVVPLLVVPECLRPLEQSFVLRTLGGLLLLGKGVAGVGLEDFVGEVAEGYCDQVEDDGVDEEDASHDVFGVEQVGVLDAEQSQSYQPATAMPFWSRLMSEQIRKKSTVHQLKVRQARNSMKISSRLRNIWNANPFSEAAAARAAIGSSPTASPCSSFLHLRCCGEGGSSAGGQHIAPINIKIVHPKYYHASSIVHPLHPLRTILMVLFQSKKK